MNQFARYDEHALLQQVKAGNETAFAELFHHYRNTVYAIAFKFLKSPVLAEEIVQDVFLKLWLKRAEAGGIQSLEAYLFVMARNFIFDRIKKKAYESDGRSSLPTHESSANDAEYLVREHQCQQLLKDAIEQLPPQQKQVYKLAKEQALSHEMIAEKMQLSRHTVKKHMAMALQTIRKHLATSLHHVPWLLFVSGALLS